MTLIKELESTKPLGELKELLVGQATAPLDGMWLCGFVPLATHYGFYDEEELVGFCCVNDEGYLLQFFLTPRHQDRSSGDRKAVVRVHTARVAHSSHGSAPCMGMNECPCTCPRKR